MRAEIQSAHTATPTVRPTGPGVTGESFRAHALLKLSAIEYKPQELVQQPFVSHT